MSDQDKQRVRTIKFGGVKYINNVSPEEINKLVNELPDDKSMAEVTEILMEKGLISVIPQNEPSPPC
ncbi:MAG: hypothetical protein ACOCQW_00195 [Halanaerobiaceae bacterium]